jgi:hypothetical protein
MIEGNVEERYERGRELAAIGAAIHEPDMIRRLPKRCPYGWNVIWHRDVMAEAGIDLTGGAGGKSMKRPRKRKA